MDFSGLHGSREGVNWWMQKAQGGSDEVESRICCACTARGWGRTAGSARTADVGCADDSSILTNAVKGWAKEADDGIARDTE